jgi:hypothetical protein
MSKTQTIALLGLAALAGCSGGGSGGAADFIIRFNDNLSWGTADAQASPAPPAGSPQVITVTVAGGGSQDVYQPGGVEIIDGNVVLIDLLIPKFVPTNAVADPENDRGKIFIDGIDTGLKINSAGLIADNGGTVRDMALSRGTRTITIKGPLAATSGSRSLFVKNETDLTFTVPNSAIASHPFRWNGTLPSNSGSTSDVHLELWLPLYVGAVGRGVEFEMGEFGPYHYMPNGQGVVMIEEPGGSVPSTIPADGVGSLQISSYELP